MMMIMAHFITNIRWAVDSFGRNSWKFDRKFNFWSIAERWKKKKFNYCKEKNEKPFGHIWSIFERSAWIFAFSINNIELLLDWKIRNTFATIRYYATYIGYCSLSYHFFLLSYICVWIVCSHAWTNNEEMDFFSLLFHPLNCVIVNFFFFFLSCSTENIIISLLHIFHYQLKHNFHSSKNRFHHIQLCSKYTNAKYTHRAHTENKVFALIFFIKFFRLMIIIV